MKTKRDRCPTCSPDSKHAIWEAVLPFDADACERVPMWECRNCHQTMPRRVVAKKPTAVSALMKSGKDYTVDDLLAAMRADLR